MSWFTAGYLHLMHGDFMVLDRELTVHLTFMSRRLWPELFWPKDTKKGHWSFGGLLKRDHLYLRLLGVELSVLNYTHHEVI